MFDAHQIITANGAACESDQPGDFSLPGLHAAAREELFAIFPQLRSVQAAFGKVMRASVRGAVAQLLAA